MYVGYLPDRGYYDPDGMSPARKKAFDTWYQDQVNNRTIFNFHEEILKYCQSDVRLLKQGCVQFQKHFKEVSGFNPMLQCITIAQACSVAYRRNWMPPNTIAVQPLHGWRPDHNQSCVALEWLYWQEDLLHCQHASTSAAASTAAPPLIAHAGNRGEHLIDHGHIRRFLVDGYNASTNTVYEFHGCFYHGCITHFPNRLQKHLYHEGKTMGEVREGTTDKIQQIRDLGYHMTEMWECQWNALKKIDPEVQTFVEDLHIDSPLNPRDAFFGGCTNATTLHFKAEPHQQIRYVDITSLYPWVNKNGMYPSGNPTFIDQPGHTDIRQYFGFIKCKVLPPYELYHPVLPHRQGHKLTFPLCRTCVETEQQKPLLQRNCFCAHTPEQRALLGTWCTPELDKAVEKGYQILYIYEIWHFMEQSDQLFTSYINTFLKTKQETSDWPQHCTTYEARQAYIDDYERHEGIRLDPDKIQDNPGLRSVETETQ